MKNLILDPGQPESEGGLNLVPSPTVQERRSRFPQWIARIIQIIFFADILIIAGLWVNGGNVVSVHTEALLLTSLGRITGLLAAYFLLIQVLLLARLPFLKALAGFDRLAVWHRWNGRVTVLFVLAHVGFIVTGYALADRLSLRGELMSLLTSYPGMVQALVGTLILILVGVTSAVIVRRRLRYETWYAVHLMAYLSIFLAWFHQIPTGNEFVENPVAAAYWTALYLVTLQLVVLFRVFQPLLRGLWHGMRVVEVIPARAGSARPAWNQGALRGRRPSPAGIPSPAHGAAPAPPGPAHCGLRCLSLRTQLDDAVRATHATPPRGGKGVSSYR